MHTHAIPYNQSRIRLTDNPLEQRLRVAIALGAVGIPNPASYTDISRLTKTASTVRVKDCTLLVSYSEVVAYKGPCGEFRWSGPRNSISKTTQRDIDAFLPPYQGIPYDRQSFIQSLKSILA